MGLLLGASVMTVFEIFDLVIYQSILKCIHAGKKARKIGSASSKSSKTSVEAWGGKF